MQPITVLSLFDGMSCGRLALERAWIPVRRYYASEIDKYAIEVSENNRPDIIQVGDVREIRVKSDIKATGIVRRPDGDTNVYVGDTGLDLLIGGSPCQWFSNAGKGLNFEDPRSKLFFEFVRILKEAHPRYFLLENVKMKKEWQNTISESLFWIQPVEIDSALVSAQRRKRLYRVWKRNEDWSYSQVIVSQPEDKGLLLKDIIQYKVEEWYYINQEKVKDTYTKQSNFLKKTLFNINPSGKGMNGNVYNPEHKSPTLTTNKGEWIKIIQLPRGNNTGGIKKDKSPTLSSNSRQHNNFLVGNQYNQRVFTDKSWCLWTGMGRTNKQGMWVYNDSITPENFIRKLTPIECERLQTLPDNYTEWVSNTQRYKMLGNGWTVDVIAHIFREMFKD